jgi:hypothetical protein
MAMPPGVQVFRRSCAGTLRILPPGMENKPYSCEITLHPPFVEPGVDVIHQLYKPLGVKDGAFIIRI